MKPWPTVADCAARLGVPTATPEDTAALAASLDAMTAWVTRQRPDLVDAGTGAPVATVTADTWQGIVILACLDYRAANSPNGFTGYDGGTGGDSAERYRAHALLSIQTSASPQVG